MDWESRRVRPSLSIALGLLVLVIVVTAAFLMGARSSSSSLTDAEIEFLRGWSELGAEGSTPPFTLLSENSDPSLMFAAATQQDLATRIDTVSGVMLAQAGELPSDTSNSLNRGDLAAYLETCADWARRVEALEPPNEPGVASRSSRIIKNLSVELRDLARQVAELCER